MNQIYKAIDVLDNTLCYFHLNDEKAIYSVVSADCCDDDQDAIDFLMEQCCVTDDSPKHPRRDDMINPVLIHTWLTK